MSTNNVKLDENVTYGSLITTNGKNDSLYEKYTISDYIIYIAFLNDYNDFIKYITGQKVVFPQVVLYLSIIKTDKSLCDLCLTYGCKLDANCVTLACMIYDADMIEYCITRDILPTNDDIKQLFNVGKYQYIDADFTKRDNTNLTTFMNKCKNFFGYLDNNYSYKVPLIFKNIYEKYAGNYTANKWISKTEYVKIKKLQSIAKGDCIDFLLEKKLANDEILKLCTDNDIKFNKSYLTVDENAKYYENLCQKKCSSSADIKNIIKELKLKIKKKEKFTKEMANYICDNSTYECNKYIVSELINISEISKNKEIMEIFLQKIKTKEITLNILNIKHDYDKKILDEILYEHCAISYEYNIVKILLENYNMELVEKHIKYAMSHLPLINYLISANKIKVSLI
jgi:hypothetical protein